jgi:hypothetical protein
VLRTGSQITLMAYRNVETLPTRRHHARSHRRAAKPTWRWPCPRAAEAALRSRGACGRPAAEGHRMAKALLPTAAPRSPRPRPGRRRQLRVAFLGGVARCLWSVSAIARPVPPLPATPRARRHTRQRPATSRAHRNRPPLPNTGARRPQRAKAAARLSSPASARPSRSPPPLNHLAAAVPRLSNSPATARPGARARAPEGHGHGSARLTPRRGPALSPRPANPPGGAGCTSGVPKVPSASRAHQARPGSAPEAHGPAQPPRPAA